MLALKSVLALCGLASIAIASSAECEFRDGSIVKENGTSVGKTVAHDGVNLYVTKPHGNTLDTAVLYLTDVFGVQLLENRLLADSFAAAGYLTVAPDLFNGTPAPSDIDTPGFNTTLFLDQHGVNVTDPIIATAIDYMRNTLKVTTIAVTGYCFGGRYAFRFIAEGKGADLAFAAHPSLLEDDEILAITGPASVAAAEVDSMMPPERREEIEALLLQTGEAYEFALYGGTSHGFGVRVNVTDPKQLFGKQSAFFQAVRWFDFWS